jgi:hypothetical protein
VNDPNLTKRGARIVSVMPPASWLTPVTVELAPCNFRTGHVTKYTVRLEDEVIIMLRSAAIIASRSNHRLLKHPPLAFASCVKTCSQAAEREISITCISLVPSAWAMIALGLIFCSAFPVMSNAAECLAPTRQSQLQTLSDCTNAMCCPRELNLQVNLVRAVARKLKSLGYTISDPSARPEDSPDLSGMYYPTLRSAVRQYKQDHNIDAANADITYEFVATLLEVNLFERWR